jgi:hypothetical protein
VAQGEREKEKKMDGSIVVLRMNRSTNLQGLWRCLILEELVSWQAQDRQLLVEVADRAER